MKREGRDSREWKERGNAPFAQDRCLEACREVEEKTESSNSRIARN